MGTLGRITLRVGMPPKSPMPGGGGGGGTPPRPALRDGLLQRRYEYDFIVGDLELYYIHIDMICGVEEGSVFFDLCLY